MSSDQHSLLPVLTTIANALTRLAPPVAPPVDPFAADAFVWHGADKWLEPVTTVNRLDVALLKGIEHQRDTLIANTRRFADGLPANNALLWGARGTGKSSIVKAVHGHILRETPGAVALIEVHREDIATLPALLSILRGWSRRCLLFCDDMTFEAEDTSYKSLKAVLDGGIEGRPENVLLYVTSNRRHLMSRQMIENEQSTAIHASEAVEEKVSLSDRFGLWLGFHNLSQDTFFAILRGYCDHYGIAISDETLQAEAVEWSVTRGSRSGRVAWQYFQDLAGRKGVRL